MPFYLKKSLLLNAHVINLKLALEFVSQLNLTLFFLFLIILFTKKLEITSG